MFELKSLPIGVVLFDGYSVFYTLNGTPIGASPDIMRKYPTVGMVSCLFEWQKLESEKTSKSDVEMERAK